MNLVEKVNELVQRYYKWFMLAALGLALFLRFLNLGQASLTDHEAEQSLQALSLVRGQSTVIGGQPGYVGLTSFLFFLFGGSEFFARFWPAIFGAVLTLVPCLFRKHLDDPTGVVLAFLLAFEPGLVALSRTADGVMITITALMLTIGFILHRKMLPAGVFFGLAMISAPAFWSLALVVVLAGVFTYVAYGQKLDVEEEMEPGDKPRWWVLLLSAVISMLLVSSQFILHPNGISGIGSGLAGFLNSWHQTSEIKVSAFLLTLLVTQFPALILGIWGLVHGLRGKQRIVRFLGLWWVLGLVFWIINPSLNLQSIVLVDLPLFVLAAMQVVVLFKGLIIRSKLMFLLEAVVTVSLIIFSLMNFLNLVDILPGDAVTVRNRIIGTLLPLALWLAFTTLMSWGWDIPSTKSGLIAGLGLLFALLLLGSGWKAAQLGSRPENELLVEQPTTTGEASLLVTIQEVARYNNGVANSIDVVISGLNSPSLVWALRDFEKVGSNSTFPLTSTPSIVVSSMDSIVQSQALYRGQMVVWSIQPDLTAMTWKDWVLWLFQRDVPQQKENLLLWVRNDLFKDISSTSQTP